MSNGIWKKWTLLAEKVRNDDADILGGREGLLLSLSLSLSLSAASI